MTQPDSLDALIDPELSRLADALLLRTRRIIRPIDAVHVEIDGRACTNFCSNNYLGLTHHPRVIEAACDATRQFGAGSGASPLVSGYSPAHASAESAVARWKSTDTAVLFPSGYQANLAAIQTLNALGKSGPQNVRFLIDKLAHASLIDAAVASGAPWRVFPHNSMSKLKRFLDDADENQIQVVITESIFSMDGDEADLAALNHLKAQRQFVLLLDEAHASGVYGPGGAGLAAERGLAQMVDIFVVTFSKAVGCAGAAICAKENFGRALLNFGRAYIYSTSIPPAAAASVEQAIAVMRDEPNRQRRLRKLSQAFRAALREKKLDVAEGDSPIVPIILGSESASLEMSQRLLEKGFLVLAVRPPTVARGTSRLRVTLSCEHSENEVDGLASALTT
jgi:8-amino-7-oxononanoate synthase